VGDAAILLKEGPHYRREAFVAGVKRHNFDVDFRSTGRRATSRDLLVTWNRHGWDDEVASRYESAGARVLVAENGYFGQDRSGRQLYALARNHHNGAGTWTEGKGDRWTPLGVELKPWRTDGRHILVLPQRGIGPRGVAMPRAWIVDIVRRLEGATDRPVRVRMHPGKEKVPLEPDFENCWAAVTWGSTAALKAIVAGIPVFYEFDRWIGSRAARFGVTNIEDPFLGDRLPMLRRLAWAQWTLAEIESGEAFRWLL